MSDADEITEKYGRLEVMKDLINADYGVGRNYTGDGAEFTVYVGQNQTAGGQLAAILKRHGYLPIYPKPFDGEEYLFKVKCEPAKWHDGGRKNCPDR